MFCCNYFFFEKTKQKTLTSEISSLQDYKKVYLIVGTGLHQFLVDIFTLGLVDGRLCPHIIKLHQDF